MAEDEAPAEKEAQVVEPHAFKPGGDNETCAVCGLFADDHVHSAASIAAHANAADSEEG